MKKLTDSTQRSDDFDDFDVSAEDWAGHENASFGSDDSLDSNAAPADVMDRRESHRVEPFIQRYSGQQVPNVGSTSIAFNPHLLRSALFGARSIVLGPERDVATVEQPVTLACGYEGWMTFTGPRWGQGHATVLFHLLSAMRGMRLDEPFEFHARDFAHRVLGWSYSVHSQQKVLQALQDLSDGAIVRPWLGRCSPDTEVRILRAPEKVGRKVSVSFDSRYEDTLHDKPTYLCLKRRRLLRVGIETWIYQFVRASSCDREMSLSRLRQLFASTKSLAEFGRDLRAALKRLKELGLIEGFKADRGRIVITKKVGTRT